MKTWKRGIAYGQELTQSLQIEKAIICIKIKRRRKKKFKRRLPKYNGYQAGLSYYCYNIFIWYLIFLSLFLRFIYWRRVNLDVNAFLVCLFFILRAETPAGDNLFTRWSPLNQLNSQTGHLFCICFYSPQLQSMCRLLNSLSVLYRTQRSHYHCWARGLRPASQHLFFLNKSLLIVS